jgi:enoyl-CoA hydratase
MTEHLEISTDGHLGRIRLNRPQAINALSLDMITGIAAVLSDWRSDPAIGAVLVEGAGEKGFCAGGDVRAVREAVLAGRAEEADHYFATEYRMNALIAGYPKPLIALTHGAVMGGGIGIAGHCQFRLTQPGARFAMPESAIGFFADVGVNAILARAPLNRALLFLLSGISVGPSDAVALGLADCVVSTEWLGALRRDLTVVAGARRPQDAIEWLVRTQGLDMDAAPFCTQADLLPVEDWDSPAAFLAAVRLVPQLAEFAALLATRSPGALAATFYAQVEARRLKDTARVLDLDLRLARLMVRRGDFAEGVRAVLVDKDQSPRWAPAHLAELDPDPIRAVIEAVPAKDDAPA